MLVERCDLAIIKTIITIITYYLSSHTRDGSNIVVVVNVVNVSSIHS